MAGPTQCITSMAWVEMLTVWFVLIDDAYQRLERRHGRWRRRGPAPRFSDSEVITVALLSDLVFGGSEAKTLHFLRQYHGDLFPCLPSNGHFNERRTRLAPLTEQVRQELSAQYRMVGDADPLRLLDSAPIVLCTYQRGGQCVSVAQAAAASGRTIKEYVGYSAKNKARFLGCRLLLSVTLDCQIDTWSLLPASVHDSVAMADLVADAQAQTFLADNAFRNPKQTDLWREEQGTIVLAPPRRNSRTPWPTSVKQWIGRLRRRIESAFGVLASGFHLERPGSRSWTGCLCRITTQLLGYTLCSITNLLMHDPMRSQTQN